MELKKAVKITKEYKLNINFFKYTFFKISLYT